MRGPTDATNDPSLPFERAHVFEVPPALLALQKRGPVHRVRTATGDAAWMVTGYDEVRQLLGDDRLGMSHPDPDNAPRVSNSALFGGRPPGNYETEHADRDRFRKLLQPYLSPRRMRALRPRVDELVGGLLDGLAHEAPPADLHRDLAVPLPVLVICELLGVPFEDRAQFRAHSQDAAAMDEERSAAGLAELWAYTRRLVTTKRSKAADDMISGLCTAERGALDDDYIAMLAAMVLFAGHETTVVQIGIGAVLLLSNPSHRPAMLGDQDAMAAAVEEYLRVGHIGGGGVPRYARTDITVGDIPIRAGELMLLDIGSANHDADIYTAPGDVDPSRQPNPHLTFGHGSHYCLGAPLARLELQAVLPQLLRRFPTMHLAVPTEQLCWRSDQLTGGFAKIPVTW